jgi:hypothetical protein
MDDEMDSRKTMSSLLAAGLEENMIEAIERNKDKKEKVST